MPVIFEAFVVFNFILISLFTESFLVMFQQPKLKKYLMVIWLDLIWRAKK